LIFLFIMAGDLYSLLLVVFIGFENTWLR